MILLSNVTAMNLIKNKVPGIQLGVRFTVIDTENNTIFNK